MRVATFGAIDTIDAIETCDAIGTSDAIAIETIIATIYFAPCLWTLEIEVIVILTIIISLIVGVILRMKVVRISSIKVVVVF